jgi:hypothetical protein
MKKFSKFEVSLSFKSSISDVCSRDAAVPSHNWLLYWYICLLQVEGLRKQSMATQGDTTCCYLSLEDACETGCGAACERASQNANSSNAYQVRVIHVLALDVSLWSEFWYANCQNCAFEGIDWSRILLSYPFFPQSRWLGYWLRLAQVPSRVSWLSVY